MTTAISPVAETLLQQLGGAGQLRAMLGTKAILADENSATFDFRLCKLANRCKVTYLPKLDFYRVEFFLVRSTNGIAHPQETFSMVYADQLRQVFEGFTGLRMSLA